ncbi:uncharacterized protein Z519_06180 [Cladophialophora bantiana CBS 173.52]|uniref:Uncharacterized protein n=1 Tax=Cladophialophora bantiana (strain ATCC 10958 / CBS 173.52 / CDC B-1940 / NIH 8579) TaxID=1442370 RepID=A0A0D2HRX3_CLAB1|nr:uncharacterized protein Z519_06180 [Cladophialophora bantiana CBS 173.52]KIW93575.1 hypothetical protein Z519_06180 [Cladophialophora bantiana CBS 173.52]
MSPLTNPPLNLSATSDGKTLASLLPSSSPQVRAEDIELPPSPSDLEPESASSSPPRSSPSKSVETLLKHSLYLSQNTTPSRPRAASPPRRVRPLSVGSVANAPPMQRAHSSPGVDASGRYITPYGVPRRPSSPLHSGRRRSPLRAAVEDPYPGVPSWSGLNIEPNIPENEELELTADAEASQPSPISSLSNTFPRARRRNAQPLHQSASAPSLYVRAMSPSISGRTSPSPSFAPQKYTYEPYPIYSLSSASSMPSTPTSLRSRSPSISSLETIEDAPDAEEAAVLEDEEAKLRGEDGDAGELRRRSSLEIRGSNLRSNKERKRWSVCGAERRADFSLEPIEE